MKLPLFLTALLALAFGACERHSWEDQVDPETGEVVEKGTKRLFEGHGHGGHEGEDGGHDGDHGDGGSHDGDHSGHDHAEGGDHGEEKPAGDEH